MTVDGPMIHRNEEEGEEEEISPRQPWAPLSDPALFSLPRSLPPPLHLHALVHLIITSGVAQCDSGWP